MNEPEKGRNAFCSFVLLAEPEWDKAALVQHLQEEWGISDTGDTEAEEAPAADIAEDEDEDADFSLVFSCGDAIFSAALIPAPIPNGEAEAAAAENYLWPEAKEQTQRHRGHLLLAVVGTGLSARECGQQLVKLTASACRQPGVLGVYANEVVYQPEFYRQFAQMLREDKFPLFNLVWIGLYVGQKGLCAYTSGLADLGYLELEVLDSGAKPSELQGFMADVTNYVASYEVVLQDGETIGFTAEQRLPISRSPGVAVEGESLKIEYMPV